jgi:hypothetical protein
MSNESNRQNEALSEHEKAYIREALRSFMRANPKPVPVSIRFLDAFERIAFSPRLQFASALAAMVLVAGSGTAFAAQSALPGDPLYGVKVNIEEPIQGAFAGSAQAKATWNSQLAARRLSEAVQLATQNKLTPQAATTIAGGLNQATEQFDASVAELATSSSNVATAASLESSMEAMLAANTQLMARIASAVPSSQPTLAPIIASAQERTVSLNSARTAHDIAAAADMTQLKAAAQAQFDAAREQVNNIALIATSSSDGSAAPQAQAAQVAFQVGQQNLNDGNYVQALVALQDASVKANEAQASASLSVQFPEATTSSASSAGTSVDATTTSSATQNATSSQRRIKNRSRQEQSQVGL